LLAEGHLHARAVRDDVAQDRAVAASGKLND
jgi:hypothetical protein